MSPDESLNRVQIMSVIIRVYGRLLLPNPGDRLVGVSVEHVHLFSASESLLPSLGQLPQVVPHLPEVGRLLQDPLRLGVAARDQLAAALLDCRDALLARLQPAQELVKLVYLTAQDKECQWPEGRTRSANPLPIALRNSASSKFLLAESSH